MRISPPQPLFGPKVLIVFAIAALWVSDAPAVAQPTKEVIVINTVNEPVPVTDVGKAARMPFQIETIIDGEGVVHNPLFSVPASQRAVIEMVSVLVTLPDVQGLGGFLSVETTADATQANHYLVLQTQGTVLTSEARTALHSVRLYADPGTQVWVNGLLPVGSVFRVTLSGYLVDMP